MDYYNYTGLSMSFIPTEAMSTDFRFTTEDYLSDYDSVSTDITSLEQPCEASSAQQLGATIIQAILFPIVLLSGVIGNGLVIATFTKYRCFRLRCMTDVFLFYLALSDLLLLLTLLLQIADIFCGGWEFGDVLCKLNNGVYAISTYGGLLLLVCISVERYMVVVRAHAAQRLRPIILRYRTLSALTVALISIVLSLPELLFSDVNKEGVDDRWRCLMNIKIEDSIWVKSCARVTKIIGFCVPCMTMLICYSAIGHVLMQGQGKCWRKQRTLRLMVALVVLFLLFQLPYTIVLFIRLFRLSNCDEWSKINLSEVITHSLTFIRCCLNPVMYALVGVRFRNDVVRLLQDCGCTCAFLKYMTPQPSTGSSLTPSSPPPTTLLPLSSANGPPKLTNGTNPQPHNDGKESANTAKLFSQQSKETTFVSWGQH